MRAGTGGVEVSTGQRTAADADPAVTDNDDSASGEIIGNVRQIGLDDSNWSAVRRPVSRRISAMEGPVACERGSSVPKSVSAETSTRFSADGTVGDVDFSSDCWTGVLEPLSDPAYFAEAAVDPEAGTVVRPGGIDLAPEPAL